ncbi:LicD family protein [Roseomonas rosea]|uniref:LicD family protein n=1 Tax=Muricoccus roseus TaxID=198092 RepID=A0A1M6AI27_9PROT|nr:LicD family protein [Roseomonas rosea]SHI35978.1 LicD family protein [Roseomonas rosea]
MSYKAGLSRSSRLELIRRTLPGLVHFDDKQLIVPLNAMVKRLKIYLPEVRALTLRGIELVSEQPLDLTRARFSMSPPEKSSSTPEAVLQSKVGIVTQEVPFPFWQVTFRAPQRIEAVAIRNERGSLAARNLALRVEYEDETGLGRTYDNTAPGLLLQRAESFAEAGKALREWGIQAGLAGPAKRATASATALYKALGQGLRDEAQPDLSEMESLRLRVIQEILAITDTAPLEHLPACLAKAAPLLEQLLHRGNDRNMPTGTEDETRAVAVIYADEFLREQHVSNSKLRENQRFTQTQERVRIVDDYVSSTYEKVTGDLSLSPIMIRSHGLSGALLHQQSDKYVGSIREIEGIFAELGYEFAICYGTFLGAYRDKRFIPHDDDVDTALLMKSRNLPDAVKEMKQIVATLQARGLTINLNANGFMKMRAPRERKRMDIFPLIDLDGERVHMHMQGLRMRDVPRAAVLPFGRIMFYGQEFKCPAQPEFFLRERYGETWNIPLRQVGAKTVVAEPHRSEALPAEEVMALDA